MSMNFSDNPRIRLPVHQTSYMVLSIVTTFEDSPIMIKMLYLKILMADSSENRNVF